MNFDFEKGELLLFNKPAGWTSFDLVKKIKKVTGAGKIGHAGTLDPLATGLLILCTGKMTREISLYQGMEKEYTGTIFLGATTPSYDREQPVDQVFPTEHITNDQIYETAGMFKGTISQLPPQHSALKIDGKRAYKLARKGKEVEMQPREVEIKDFEITSLEMPLVGFRVVCSKGTYIRSLAHDFGKALGSGALLASLCRTRIGEFDLEKAFELEDFINLVQQKP